MKCPHCGYVFEPDEGEEDTLTRFNKILETQNARKT